MDNDFNEPYNGINDLVKDFGKIVLFKIVVKIVIEDVSKWFKFVQKVDYDFS